MTPDQHGMRNGQSSPFDMSYGTSIPVSSRSRSTQFNGLADQHRFKGGLGGGACRSLRVWWREHRRHFDGGNPDLAPVFKNEAASIQHFDDFAGAEALETAIGAKRNILC